MLHTTIKNKKLSHIFKSILESDLSIIFDDKNKKLFNLNITNIFKEMNGDNLTQDSIIFNELVIKMVTTLLKNSRKKDKKYFENKKYIIANILLLDLLFEQKFKKKLLSDQRIKYIEKILKNPKYNNDQTIKIRKCIEEIKNSKKGIKNKTIVVSNNSYKTIKQEKAILSTKDKNIPLDKSIYQDIDNISVDKSIYQDIDNISVDKNIHSDMKDNSSLNINNFNINNSNCKTTTIKNNNNDLTNSEEAEINNILLYLKNSHNIIDCKDGELEKLKKRLTEIVKKYDIEDKKEATFGFLIILVEKYNKNVKKYLKIEIFENASDDEIYSLQKDFIFAEQLKIGILPEIDVFKVKKNNTAIVLSKTESLKNDLSIATNTINDKTIQKINYENKNELKSLLKIAFFSIVSKTNDLKLENIGISKTDKENPFKIFDIQDTSTNNYYQLNDIYCILDQKKIINPPPYNKYTMKKKYPEFSNKGITINYKPSISKKNTLIENIIRIARARQSIFSNKEFNYFSFSGFACLHNSENLENPDSNVNSIFDKMFKDKSKKDIELLIKEIFNEFTKEVIKSLNSLKNSENEEEKGSFSHNKSSLANILLLDLMLEKENGQSLLDSENKNYIEAFIELNKQDKEIKEVEETITKIKEEELKKNKKPVFNYFCCR